MEVPTAEQPEPLRVLLCSTGFPRSEHDTHKPFLLHHAQALAAEGVNVTVVCPAAAGLPANETLGGVEVVRFRYAPGRFETLAYDGAMYKRVVSWHGLLVPVFVVAFFWVARREAKRRRVHVIHAHWWAPSGLVAWAAALSLRGQAGARADTSFGASGRAGPRSVVHLHGSDAAIAKGPVKALAKWLFRRVDAVCAVGDELASWCETLSGVEALVVPMPLRPSFIAEPGETTGTACVDGETAGANDGIAGDRVLGVGRLVPEKGFDVLVRAAALSKLPLTIAGSGPEQARLEELAKRLHVSLTLVGEVGTDELVRLYRQAAVVAIPSYREGFGMVAAEAAALGKVVVGSAVGGIPTVVANGVNGFLVPPGNAEALAEALVKAVARPEMGLAGRQMVASLHPKAHAATLIALYREVLRMPVG